MTDEDIRRHESGIVQQSVEFFRQLFLRTWRRSRFRFTVSRAIVGNHSGETGDRWKDAVPIAGAATEAVLQHHGRRARAGNLETNLASLDID
jgi:hypothetical protein